MQRSTRLDATSTTTALHLHGQTHPAVMWILQKWISTWVRQGTKGSNDPGVLDAQTSPDVASGSGVPSIQSPPQAVMAKILHFEPSSVGAHRIAPDVQLLIYSAERERDTHTCTCEGTHHLQRTASPTAPGAQNSRQTKTLKQMSISTNAAAVTFSDPDWGKQSVDRPIWAPAKDLRCEHRTH